MKIKIKVIAPFDEDAEAGEEIMFLDVPEFQARESAQTLMDAMGKKFNLLRFRMVQVGVKQFNIIGEPIIQ